MIGQHPSIVIPQTSEYAKERVRHEAHYTQYGPPGKPFVYQEFPKRLYKATRGENGVTLDGFTVANDEEQGRMASRGYCLSQQEALDAERKEHLEVGKLAAEREWEIHHGRISPKAAAEVRAAEEAHGARHLPSVPETPIKRRTRGPNKPKVTA
jgi:hypothetical protein